jgi:hypothetical protein
MFLAESRAPHHRRIDFAGTLLLGFAMAAFLSGLTQSRMGWNQPSPCILLIGGLVLMGAFVTVERRLGQLDVRSLIIRTAGLRGRYGCCASPTCAESTTGSRQNKGLAKKSPLQFWFG